jgi:hypothetical protein
MGWFFDDYWHRGSYSTAPGLAERFEPDDRMTGPMRAYNFFDGNPQKIQRQKERGVLPWWTSDDLRIRFWRPIGGLLLDLDYTLWPERAWLMHLHSLLWYGGLAVMVTLLFRSIMGAGWAAGLAALLYIVDDSLAWPAVFLANRHMLVAIFFGVLSLWAYDQARKSTRRGWDGLALLAFAFSLLSCEGGIAVLGYILAYSRFLDSRPWLARLRSVGNFLLLILVWRLVYSGLGYGSIGNELYIDPVREPLIFIKAFFLRFPVYLWGLLGFPPSQVYLFLSDSALPFYGLGTLLAGGLVLGWTFPLWRNCRVCQFWLGGMLMALIPLCSALPGNRSLGIAALGGMGFLAQGLARYGRMDEHEAPSPLWRWGMRGLVGAAVVVHGVLSPLEFISSPIQMRLGQSGFNEIMALPEVEAIETKSVVFMQSPMGLFFTMYETIALLEGKPLPREARLLASGVQPLQVTRVDERTLTIRMERGLLPPAQPSPRENLRWWHHIHYYFSIQRLERLTMNRVPQFKLGLYVQLRELEVSIDELTEDGRPRTIRFRWNRPLEDPSLVWLMWKKALKGFERWEPIPVGETAVLSIWDSRA